MFDFGSVRARSRLNFTAAASSGVPSWNLMPLFSVSVNVCGSVNSHDLASPGTGVSVSGSKEISVSKIG